MTTKNQTVTPAEALRLFQALRPYADQNRWQRAVAGVSSLSLSDPCPLGFLLIPAL